MSACEKLEVDEEVPERVRAALEALVDAVLGDVRESVQGRDVGVAAAEQVRDLGAEAGVGREGAGSGRHVGLQ